MLVDDFQKSGTYETDFLNLLHGKLATAAKIQEDTFTITTHTRLSVDL